MKYLTNINDLDLNGTYTYADYLTWRFEQSVELIKGKIFPITPAPRVVHQKISFNLSGLLYNQFKHQDCKAFSAPFDVRLLDKKKSSQANQEIYTVVQPDICVISDRDKLDERG